jgi:glycosyltransferase involved in cell wall biosynthesis
MSFRVAYVVSHPIQYQAPLLRYLTRAGIDLRVFFLSDFSLHEHYERPFNRSFKWDIALTEGYASETLHRPFCAASRPPSRLWPVNHPAQTLRAGRFDALWLHGWGYLANCQMVHSAAAIGLPVLLRGESLPNRGPNTGVRERMRRSFYSRWLFNRSSAFLYVGSRNYEFYRSYGVARHRLFRMPYTVDNSFFQIRCSEAQQHRDAFRRSLGLSPGRPVVLFTGKLIPRKAPDALLAAFKLACARLSGQAVPYLLYAGDGPSRRALEHAARPLGDAVRFIGFRNQTELPALYDLCDVFVLPSTFEPWGLALNEAMNAGRAVLVSDSVGAAADLVADGDNGFVFRSGDIEAFVGRLLQLLQSPRLRARMGERSLERIQSWNFAADYDGLLEALTAVCHNRGLRTGGVAQ